MRANEFITEAVDNYAIASKYVGDGQFKLTINNKPAIVTVGGFELNHLDTGRLDSFYLTNSTTGKTEHIDSGWNDPLAQAIFNNLDENQKPALKQIYAKDYAWHEQHGWDEQPERLQGLTGGPVAIPAERFLKARQDMKKITGQQIDDVDEAQDWQGNQGVNQAETTDHTMDEAIEYVKGNYPYAKKYRVSRAEPGFRAQQDPSQFNRSAAHVNDVDSAMDYLQLRENPVMSGSAQPTPSLGYSWHTNENRGSGIAVLYYEDRGMGWDEIIVAAKDKKNLASAVQVFRDAGVIK